MRRQTRKQTLKDLHFFLYYWNRLYHQIKQATFKWWNFGATRTSEEFCGESHQHDGIVCLQRGWIDADKTIRANLSTDTGKILINNYCISFIFIIKKPSQSPIFNTRYEITIIHVLLKSILVYLACVKKIEILMHVIFKNITYTY